MVALATPGWGLMHRRIMSMLAWHAKYCVSKADMLWLLDGCNHGHVKAYNPVFI